MFEKKIIDWYLKNKRDLPWRSTNNPYFIWLSEIILQQTRVNQGLPYYNKFIEKYPTVGDLAKAEEADVLRTWQGLGYYSRARNLHKTAKEVSHKLNGSFPDNFIALKSLKGIGDYTAAAIASIAFKQRVPVVDGNVMRVLSRYFEYTEAIDSNKAKKWFFETALELMPIENKSSSNFNQAMMELGALICTPKNPNCLHCPLNDSCLGLKNKSFENLPYKAKKTKVNIRHITYLVFYNDNGMWLKKRGSDDIWSQLFDFPEESNLLQNDVLHLNTLENESAYFPLEFNVEHKLTHLKLIIKFKTINNQRANTFIDIGNFFDYDEIENLPKPIVIANFITKFHKNTINISL